MTQSPAIALSAVAASAGVLIAGVIYPPALLAIIPLAGIAAKAANPYTF